jgi:hypothetical protein
MNEGKRKIGEYTVLCSVNVGEKEVILASNEQSTNGDKFMCGFAERNDLFELCSECMVSDDYIEIVHLFGSRVANEAELFKEQVEKLDIPITLITEADCIPDHYSKDINGKIIAIDPKVLKPEFQRADRQLYYVTGGFGASANSRGSAVFCTNLHTGKSTRYERMDVMGEIKPERLPEWAKEKAQELSNKKRNNDKEDKAMKENFTFQQKTKLLTKLFDAGCNTEKKLQQLDMESILKIPGITIPDMSLIIEFQKQTKANKLFSYLGGGTDEQAGTE